MGDFLDRFAIKPEVQNIFKQGLIEDKDSIIEILEDYHFLSRDDILKSLKGSDDLEFVSVDTENPPKLQRYNQNVLAQIVDDANANVYIRGFASVNMNRIELDLCKYTVKFYRITVVNFKRLVVPEYEPEYDPVILFKRILLEAIDKHATDIHFEVKHYNIAPDYTVAFRIDGDMFDYDEFKLNARLNKDMISKIVESKTNVASLDLNSADGITAVAKDVLGTGIAELRISANKVLDGYHYVIRIQKKDTVQLTLPELGFDFRVRQDLEYVVRKRSGITLITGAVRTGKNTTAFAIENEMVKLPVKVVSYEYPIEVLMPVSQVDYANNENILLNAIRLAKKQDVNVAFINEIPNKEVAFAVQDLVNSSIHVITTMHLDRLWLLPYRLKEYYGSSYKDVISQINAVFNQKMFSIPCPHCREQFLVASLEDDRKRELLEQFGVRVYYKSHGCSVCKGTGRVIGGNQPYAEHVVFTPDIVSELLKCEEPYQMEQVLHDTIVKQHTTLEDYMTNAIGQGKLALEALDSLV